MQELLISHLGVALGLKSQALTAVSVFRHHYGWSPPIDIVDVGQAGHGGEGPSSFVLLDQKVRFPFIKQYLNYIMPRAQESSRAQGRSRRSRSSAKRPCDQRFELIKNSLRAVVERRPRRGLWTLRVSALEEHLLQDVVVTEILHLSAHALLAGMAPEKLQKPTPFVGFLVPSCL